MKMKRSWLGLLGIVLSALLGLTASATAAPVSPPGWSVPRYALYSSSPTETADNESLKALAGLGKALPTGASSFVGITPCRLVDTRGNGFGGAYGPPSLLAEVARDFVLTGRCGVPTNAVAVSLNFTVVAPTGDGFLATFPAAGAVPLVSTMNFRAGQVLANAAIVPLGAGGGITVYSSGASTQLLIDVNGYFVVPPAGQKLCSVFNGTFRDTIPAPASWVSGVNYSCASATIKTVHPPFSREPAAVAGGLWETRSVFQGVWEGAGRRGGGGSLPCPGRPPAGEMGV
jgi:hypothetical protein